MLVKKVPVSEVPHQVFTCQGPELSIPFAEPSSHEEDDAAFEKWRDQEESCS